MANQNEPPVDEQLCNHCGKCCYKKIIVGRTVFITPFPCEYLDTDTNHCTIYDRRKELNPYCLSVHDGLKVSAFPADCPYVEAHAPPKYRPARDDWNWTGEWEGFDDLADDLEVTDAIREKVRARGPDAPPMWTEAQVKSQKAKVKSEQSRRQLLWGEGAAVVVDMSKQETVTVAAPTLAALAGKIET